MKDELAQKLGEAETFDVQELNGLRDLMILSKQLTSNDHIEVNTEKALRMAKQILESRTGIVQIKAIYHADLVVARPDGMAVVVIVQSGLGFRTEYFWLTPIYKIPSV